MNKRHILESINEQVNVIEKLGAECYLAVLDTGDDTHYSLVGDQSDVAAAAVELLHKIAELGDTGSEKYDLADLIIGVYLAETDDVEKHLAAVKSAIASKQQADKAYEMFGEVPNE